MIKETLKYSKSTKGTHVYTATKEKPAIPTLYVKRDALPDKPEEISVTIVEV